MPALAGARFLAMSVTPSMMVMRAVAARAMR
jgi:hypothetical protein